MRKTMFRVIGLLAVSMFSLIGVHMKDASARSRSFPHFELPGSGQQPVSGTFAAGSTYSVCFVPDGASCQDMIINELEKTQKTLLIQGYEFTSAPIAKAVINAKKRGVDVRIILDQSQVSSKFSSARFFFDEGLPVAIDDEVKIAHNKVMIFDGSTVFLGSFNFTKSAQERNAENGMLVGGDINIVRAYTENWNKRLAVSKPYSG